MKTIKQFYLPMRQTIITIIICLAVLAGVNVIYAWTDPPYQGVCNDPPCPPGGNVPAPINAGGVTQYKSGALGIGGVFQSYGGTADPVLNVVGDKVGIGTPGPGMNLHVRGANQDTIQYLLNLTGPNAAGINESFYIGITGGATPEVLLTTDWGAGGTNPRLSFSVGTQPAQMTLSGGKVGIGTTNPNSSKGTGGYLDVKDVYLRDAGKWASEMGGGAKGISCVDRTAGTVPTSSCDVKCSEFGEFCIDAMHRESGHDRWCGDQGYDISCRCCKLTY